MSQVIPSHVLRVGQTVCVASQEESARLRAAGCAGCSALRAPFAYYSADGWAEPATAARASAPPLPNGARPGSRPACEHAAPRAQGNGQQGASLERAGVPCRPKEGDAGQDPDAPLMSPTLDISIESLNQLILEIDPTFQPLTCTPLKEAARGAPQRDLVAAKKQDTDATDFKYIEMTPARAKCAELLQGSPLSRSPQDPGPLPQKGGLRGSAAGSVAFCSPPGSESISIPPKDGGSCSPGVPLGASPARDALLKPLHMLRAQQRSSGISLLSNSPGSDTSYVLCSSTHSLPNDDSDAPCAASCSTECPSPAGSLGSPYPSSPSVRSPSGDAFGPDSLQPRSTCSPKASASPPQKGQASSCPPSILSAAADVPMLLVNGCLERGDAAGGPPAWAKQSPPPGCSPCPGLGALNNALSAPLLSCVPDSPPRDGQPTMKFVMDTSKYWFKPSITREQAIQLLKDKEPGTFVVRDSTSYRGSFGLAMKVPVPPSGSQTGDDSSDLVRHFLIESSAKGVHLKGASEQLYFGSLSAFVYQHAMTALALPCRLRIPGRDLADGENSPDWAPESTGSPLQKTAVCNVLYLNSVTVETLTAAPAIQKAVSSTFELETLPTPTLVHFKATEQGITLTDIQRKVFFRRHYPLASIRFCGMDPENRKWQKYCRASRIFGFVAKSQTDLENLCHLFAEYDTVQSASLVIDFVRKLLPGP
ncbi:TENS4 protein, partial [Nothocercus julius]|nr:TENS4 protein [Nothocercus julius]